MPQLAPVVDVPHQAVEARAAVRRVDVGAALREAVRLFWRGAAAGGVLGESGGRGSGGGEGGEERVEVGLERAAPCVVRVARAALVLRLIVGVGRSDEERRAEEKDGEKAAMHGSMEGRARGCYAAAIELM